jgi:tetratricopeptide (TPR) repeat protein
MLVPRPLAPPMPIATSTTSTILVWSNAGAAAAGAGYANRNQSPYSNAGAAAAGATYANRNQSPYSNAGAAAAGATYANRNQYNQYHPGMVNGYWNGNGYGGYGYGGYGYGGGVGAWGAGSPMYGWGYSGYSNPYYGAYSGTGGVAPGSTAQQSAAAPYNYSQPISTTAAPPDQAVASQSTSAFDQARGAFKAGDYGQALQLDQQALAQMPNDTTMHEFLALVLFAQGKFDQAASPLYAVLSVGPGWDWTTLSGMYPDVATYTGQLRALEANVRANPDAAAGHFVLAYHYLCQAHVDNAVAQLKRAVQLQPADTLSAQLIAQLQPSSGSQPSPAVPVAGAEGKLAGNWAAAPGNNAQITLAIQDDGHFTWAASSPGKPTTTITGASALADGVLTLTAQGSQDGALTGKVAWKDADHFTFQLVGAPSTDPGLSFAR